MTNEAVVAVGLRLVGIWIGLKIVLAMLLLVPALGNADWQPPWLSLAIEMLWLLIAAAMIFAPMPIAEALLPKEQHGEGTTAWNIEDFQRVAFAAVGLYILVLTFSSTNTWITVWQYLADGSSIGWVYLTEVVLKIAVGLWLLLGAKGLHGILRMARTAGTR